MSRIVVLAQTKPNAIKYNDMLFSNKLLTDFFAIMIDKRTIIASGNSGERMLVF